MTRSLCWLLVAAVFIAAQATPPYRTTQGCSYEDRSQCGHDRWLNQGRTDNAVTNTCWRVSWCRGWLMGNNMNNPPGLVNTPIIASPNKRDIFMSRGWGAGGMPFSVLYLNPRKLKQQQQQQQQQHRQTRFSPMDESLGSAAVLQPLYPQPISAARMQDDLDLTNMLDSAEPPRPPQAQVGLRPGSHSQQNKQHSVLPQLFISYGWGPLGK